MKTKLVSILLSLPSLTAFGATNADEYKLGNGAVILETQEIKPNRTLVLWMVRPIKHPRETPSEPYSCPEYTRGNFYSGATRVSLVDPQTHKVINTIKVSTGADGAGDKFDLPIRNPVRFLLSCRRGSRKRRRENPRSCG